MAGEDGAWQGTGFFVAPRPQAVLKTRGMTPPAGTPPVSSRLLAALEWLVVLGLGATVAWTTLCLGGYLAETMVVTSWLVFALAALGALLWAVDRRPLHRAIWLPVPFLLYALASTTGWAPAPWLGWREWLLAFQTWLVFGVMLHVGRGRGHQWFFAGLFSLLGLAGVAMAAYQRFVDPAWMMLGRTQAEQFRTRSAGMFGIPNSLAGLLELMIPLCLVLLSGRSVRPAVRIVGGWLAALFVFALVLTGSRGGWLGVGVALLLWPLLGGGGWKRRLLGLVAVGVAASVALVALYQYSEAARERLDPILEGKFEASRPIMWKAAWQMWQDAPWIGRGAAAYNVLFDQYRPRGFITEPDWTHNDYLNTLSDYGLIGLALAAVAGVGILGAGWRGVIRARREERRGGGVFAHWRWRFGLWLGLIAYAVHLGVDFHTKIPALAFLAAVAAAWLVREEETWRASPRRWLAWGSAVVLVALTLVIGWRVASPAYRAEALRYEARRSIDRYARTGTGDLRTIVPAARAAFIQATRIDPDNGQAWSDLAYATVQMLNAGGTDRVTLGRIAELAADEALQQGPVVAEFWVRKAVALDVQRGRPEAEECYRRALELAPNSAAWWFYYAHHLQAFPNRTADALQAVETCLSLDRPFVGAEALRQQLLSRLNPKSPEVL